MKAEIRPADLWALSHLFRYPDAQALSAPIREEVGAEVRALFAERQRLDPLRLENEYIRLFVNGLPEVPCAPYGSLYLEGTIMGASTVQVAKIYQKYGLTTKEMPDHIAVECEFLAWLHQKAQQSSDVDEDFDFLFGHLRQWIVPFLARVEQHDRLGWYRSCAAWSSRLFLHSEPNG